MRPSGVAVVLGSKCWACRDVEFRKWYVVWGRDREKERKSDGEEEEL